jgi:PKD repeat protein
MNLYIDGVRVGRREDVRTGMSREGWWRVGGDALTGWPNRPTSDYFEGAVDEVAIYHHGLTAQRVADHYTQATGVVPNQPPTATFTVQQNELAIDVDAHDSGDPDGSIASYDWDWGDGTPHGSGVTASHTYTQSGTHDVTLTVTDDDGATASTSQSVEVSRPAVLVGSDKFERRLAGAWGDADLGGPWTPAGASNRFSVAQGQGRITANASTRGAEAYLSDLDEADLTGRVDFSTNKAVTGAGTSFAVVARHSDKSDYRFTLRIRDNGSVRLYVMRQVGGTSTRLGKAYLVPGLTYSAGKVLRLQFEVSGAPSASLKATVWKVGKKKPGAPQVVRTDSTPELADPGGLGLSGSVSGSTTNLPVQMRFDNLTVTSLD